MGYRDGSKEENHRRFLRHLKGSREAVWRAARWLGERGYTVTVPPTTFSEDYRDRMSHTDKGDLYIDKERRVEVKHRTIHFETAGDWLYPNFFVCAKHSYDRATPKPSLYMIFNKSMSHAAIVRGDTSPHWYVITKPDPRYENYSQEFYCCPINLVDFIPTGEGV